MPPLAGQIALLFTTRILLPLVIVPIVGGALVFGALKVTRRPRPYFQCWKAYLAGSCYCYFILFLLSFLFKASPGTVTSHLILDASIFFITQMLALVIILRDRTARALLAQAVAVGFTNLTIFVIALSVT